MEGNADVGIGYLLKENQRITRINIKKADFLLISEKNAGEGIPVKEALKGPLVHFEEGVDLRGYIEQHLGRALSIVMELPSIESILHYVYRGFGCSIVPDFSLNNYWKGKIAVKQLHGLIPPMDIFAYTRDKRILSKAAEKFLEILRKRKRLRKHCG